MIYVAPTDDQAEELTEAAYEWFNNQNPARMFIDCRSASVGAVKEFLANQRVLTFFKSGVGVELPETDIKKPTPQPLQIINWNEAMSFIEEKYGFETEGKNYPVTLLYYFLESMDYIPKGSRGIIKIPFPTMNDPNCIPTYDAIRRGMEEDVYRGTIIKLIDIIVEEFPLNNGKVYWEF